jgi:phosphoglycolate phosphatase-like HAD superfamily hydrolase
MSEGPRRLVLWDIDGTLLHGGPAAREVFADAVATVTGMPSDDGGVRMSGKTDPLIALEIMAHAGIAEEEARSYLPKVLLALEEGLEAAAGRIRTEGRVHPGAVNVLRALSEDPAFVQSVLTGNLKANARVKLASFGLDRYLDLDVGAYGSDDRDRSRLIPIALRRVEERRGWSPSLEDVWIIGDTPRDLDAARATGVRCLLVATGGYGFDELAALGADAALPHLEDTEAVLRVLGG